MPWWMPCSLGHPPPCHLEGGSASFLGSGKASVISHGTLAAKATGRLKALGTAEKGTEEDAEQVGTCWGVNGGFLTLVGTP